MWLLFIIIANISQVQLIQIIIYNKAATCNRNTLKIDLEPLAHLQDTGIFKSRHLAHLRGSTTFEDELMIQSSNFAPFY